MSLPVRFNIRVYGLLINRKRELLIVHESINDFHFTKFPGGGMELGEGTIDCLKREFREELQLNIEVGKHFYTTDFYQPSAFKVNDQLVSIYYFVHAEKEHHFFANHTEESESKVATMKFEWVPLDSLSKDMLTFPIDKIVCDQLLKSVN
ncbi:MAG: NUDIX hydrolase [Bacteroidia bacterium]